MTIILLEHNNGCFDFQWEKKERNRFNRSSHLQNKIVHYNLFGTHIMSTYNRINRDDQGFKKKRLILTVLSGEVRKSSLVSFYFIVST
jgi:hypothetical protein